MKNKLLYFYNPVILTVNGPCAILYTSKQLNESLKMNLTEIIENNPKARTIILSQNIADIAKKYGISLSDAKKLQCYAAWLDMHSVA